jgi:hypothetical protein
MATPLKLDHRTVEKLPHPVAGQVVYRDAHPKAPPGFGLRVTAKSKRWVLDYHHAGKQRRVTLAQAFPEWGPEAARIEAAKLKTVVHAGGDPMAQRDQARLARKVMAEAAPAPERTVGALLELYVDALEKAGKSSARKVKQALARHVQAAHPALWAASVDTFGVDDVLTILDPLMSAGKEREAGKLRSAIRAAFALGMAARTRPGAAPHLRALRVTTNPARDVESIGKSRPRAHAMALSVAELRAYWQRLRAMPGPDGALLRLHLLTGAQRVEQLVRADFRALDRDANLLTLSDPKGRRDSPRAHVVPLLPEAVEAIGLMNDRPGPKNPFVVTLDQGRTPASYSAVYLRVCAVAAAMAEAGECRERFTPGALRSAVETQTAAAGVSRETRAHLQSHGLGGVQTRHYDRHDYLLEKNAALRVFRDLLGAGE